MNPLSSTENSTGDGLPLSQVSPERVNIRSPRSGDNDAATAFPYTHASPLRRKHQANPSISPYTSTGLPASPSLPEFSAIRTQLRTNTDVSGLVKRFEHLDVRDRDAESVERRQKQEEALDRAKVAREEAESEAKRWRDDARAQSKALAESKDREWKACKRIDLLMDEFSRAKEQWSSQTSIYEKEVRKARKEAFKSSSAVLKTQEETKSARAELRATQSKLEMAQRKTATSEHETFAAQYKLVAVQEELECLQARLKIVDEEREALKGSVKGEELARMATEGRIALPFSTYNNGDEDLVSPRKPTKQRSMLHAVDEDKENAGVVTKKMVDMRNMQNQLLTERARLHAAEDMIDFLRLECIFSCCRCHTAKRKMSIDDETRLAAEKLRMNMHAALGSSPKEDRQDLMDGQESAVLTTLEIPVEIDADDREFQCASSVAPSNREPLQGEPSAPRQTPIDVRSEDALQDEGDQPPSTPGSQRPHHSQHGLVRTITTITKVPMLFTPLSKPASIPLPVEFEDDESKQISSKSTNETEVIRPDAKSYAFDREAALAAIAYRRGRARSFAQGNMTPRRQMLEGVKERRDISAPALTG